MEAGSPKLGGRGAHPAAGRPPGGRLLTPPPRVPAVSPGGDLHRGGGGGGGAAAAASQEPAVQPGAGAHGAAGAEPEPARHLPRARAGGAGAVRPALRGVRAQVGAGMMGWGVLGGGWWHLTAPPALALQLRVLAGGREVPRGDLQAAGDHRALLRDGGEVRGHGTWGGGRWGSEPPGVAPAPL